MGPMGIGHRPKPLAHKAAIIMGNARAPRAGPARAVRARPYPQIHDRQGSSSILVGFGKQPCILGGTAQGAGFVDGFLKFGLRVAVIDNTAARLNI